LLILIPADNLPGRSGPVSVGDVSWQSSPLDKSSEAAADVFRQREIGVGAFRRVMVGGSSEEYIAGLKQVIAGSKSTPP
jgi:hypothetical protein